MRAIAQAAGISTRTIYERYANKGQLLTAVVAQLVHRAPSTIFTDAELSPLEPEDALALIAHRMIEATVSAKSGALFRVVAAEAKRFPELAAMMFHNIRAPLYQALANYLHSQAQQGKLASLNSEGAAKLFIQMIFAELYDCWIYGPPTELSRSYLKNHVDTVVGIFLHGATLRGSRSSRAPDSDRVQR